MGKAAKILIIIVLSLFFCVSSFAQNTIAVIDTNAFEDEATGIKELVSAKKFINSIETNCDIKCSSLYDQYVKLSEEIKKSKKSTEKKLAQRTKIKKELDHLRSEKVFIYRNLWKTILSPISFKIKEKLWNFRSLKGYKEIYYNVNGKTVSIFNDKYLANTTNLVDITKEFIKFCNEEFEKEKTQK